MITYYILLPNDKNTDSEHIELGTDNGFGKFWGGTGLSALHKIVNQHPELIDSVTIITDQGKKMGINEFIEIIGKLNIVFN